METRGQGCVHSNTTTEAAPAQTCFSEAKPEVVQRQGLRSAGGCVPHCQLPGLREVGALTTSVGWTGPRLRNHKAAPAQGCAALLEQLTAFSLFL